MGSWNETCALTRTPIGYGEPVVFIETVSGPSYKNRGCSENPLFFGLAMRGSYDSYGGVENLQAPDQKAFADKAFANSGLYREMPGKEHWLASSSRTLWGLERSLQHVFYRQHGVSVTDVNSYEPKARERTMAAYKQCEAALKNLGRKLQKATLPQGAEALTQAVFELVASEFGEEAAWSAYMHMSSKGLYASRGHILMNASAYDALVKNFSSRKTYYYGDKRTTPLRDFLAQTLDSWFENYQAERERLQKMEETIRKAREQAKASIAQASAENADDLDDEDDRLSGLCDRMSPGCDYLQALSQPWMTPEAPFVGHFWGGATAKEVLEAFPREQILDFMVFQWARSYLRVDLKAAPSGSQNEEVQLHYAVHQAAYRSLRKNGRLPTDFYGCIHRR